MESLAIILAVGAMNILCFLVGVNVRQKVDKGEPVKVTPPNVVAAVREHKQQVAADTQREYYDTILRNVDSYDPYGGGQEEVPG
ncbi:MAG: hypothetical protein IKK11_06135 [Oscillospiraceae bacterium]|nr:hypothetical protein [Oscillospiraceae bacterium]